MQVSPAGIKLITTFEGLKLAPYKDVGDRPTIGYGHLITVYEPLLPKIDLEEALALLHKDLDETVHQLNLALFGVPVTQPQFDALCSLVFNIGPEAFKGSTLLRLLKAGDFQGAACEFIRWDHVAGKVVLGLLARREAEKALFLSPVVTVA